MQTLVTSLTLWVGGTVERTFAWDMVWHAGTGRDDCSSFDGWANPFESITAFLFPCWLINGTHPPGPVCPYLTCQTHGMLGHMLDTQLKFQTQGMLGHMLDMQLTCIVFLRTGAKCMSEFPTLALAVLWHVKHKHVKKNLWEIKGYFRLFIFNFR